MYRVFCFALAVLTVAPVVPGVAASNLPSAALLAEGHGIAKKNCGRCHAIAARDRSADRRSPPFRELSRRYPLSGLEEPLAEGIMVGHEGLEMPHFQLTPAQIEALLAYMGSVQRK
jgi:cytochrome c